jgi:hypothetical protein
MRSINVIPSGNQQCGTNESSENRLLAQEYEYSALSRVSPLCSEAARDVLTSLKFERGWRKATIGMVNPSEHHSQSP